jgi:hypothetical protein
MRLVPYSGFIILPAAIFKVDPPGTVRELLDGMIKGTPDVEGKVKLSEVVPMIAIPFRPEPLPEAVLPELLKEVI